MRKVGIIGAAIILASSVGVAFAQERAPQHVGYGTGVGDSQGVGDRSRVMDEGDMLRYLSAAETVQGELVAVNKAGGLMYLDMGGSSQDERQSLTGSMNMQPLYFDDNTNMESVNAMSRGDYVQVQVRQEVTEAQKFSTGRKIVQEVYLMDRSQLLGGADNVDFGGGFGQRPDPSNYRGLSINHGGNTGAPAGGSQPGQVMTGISSPVGATTGAAPCWQCAPQPDTVNGRTDKTIATDYGDNRNNFNKGTVQ